jgi:hypothetical protein
MWLSPLSEPRFLHGIVGKEAPQEDVEAQIPQASQGESPQAEVIRGKGRQQPAHSSCNTSRMRDALH